VLSFSGGFARTPHQGLCPWTPLGAPPPDPRRIPLTEILDPPLGERKRKVIPQKLQVSWPSVHPTSLQLDDLQVVNAFDNNQIYPEKLSITTVLIMGVDHGGTQNLEREGLFPQILSCCKILSTRLLALQCRKMCYFTFTAGLL